jgi:predicted nucleotidyltransferase
MNRDHSQFALWEAATERRRTANEAERRRLLANLLAWLDAHAPEHGIDEAWVLGSVTRPGRFGAHSDIDLALGRDPRMRQFRVGAELSQTLARDVDVILLEDCPFAALIVEEGIQWTRFESAA